MSNAHDTRYAESETRLATWSDVDALNRFLPPVDVASRHEARLKAQDADEIAYMLGLIDGRPVGHAFIRWAGYPPALFPELAKAFPEMPVISRLLVLEEQRGRGIASSIVRALEELAIRRDRHGIAVGVEPRNQSGFLTWRALGYREWRHGPHRVCYSEADADGIVTRKDMHIIPMSRSITRVAGLDTLE